jgi:hypothetical protein
LLIGVTWCPFTDHHGVSFDEELNGTPENLNKMRHLIELSVDVPEMSANIQKLSGDEKSMNMLREAMSSEKKEKALRSYVEGLKRDIKIKIDTKLIS